MSVCMLDTWEGRKEEIACVDVCTRTYVRVHSNVLKFPSAFQHYCHKLYQRACTSPAWLQHVLQNVFPLRAARVECVYHRLLDGALITIIKPFDSQGVLFLGLSFDNKKREKREGSSLRSGCRNCWLALSLPDSHWRAPASLKVTPL